MFEAFVTNPIYHQCLVKLHNNLCSYFLFPRKRTVTLYLGKHTCPTQHPPAWNWAHGHTQWKAGSGGIQCVTARGTGWGRHTEAPAFLWLLLYAAAKQLNQWSGRGELSRAILNGSLLHKNPRIWCLKVKKNNYNCCSYLVWNSAIQLTIISLLKNI